MLGERRSFRSFDGEPLYYHVTGEGPPLLLANGFVCTTQYWPPVIEYLKQFATVLTWDYRGHGTNKAPKDLDTATIPHAAQDIKALLDDFGVSNILLIGHSMGSQVIFEFARVYPGWVRGLVSVCGSCESPFLSSKGRNTPQQRILLQLLQLAKPFPGPTAFFLKPLLKTPITMELTYRLGANRKLVERHYIDALYDHVTQMDFAAASRFLESMMQHSTRSHLPQLRVPTLLIGGTRDALVPVDTLQKMSHEIPFSVLKIYEECSHLAMLEKFDEVMKDLSTFLIGRDLL